MWPFPSGEYLLDKSGYVCTCYLVPVRVACNIYPGLSCTLISNWWPLGDSCLQGSLALSDLEVNSLSTHVRSGSWNCDCCTGSTGRWYSTEQGTELTARGGRKGVGLTGCNGHWCSRDVKAHSSRVWSGARHSTDYTGGTLSVT